MVDMLLFACILRHIVFYSALFDVIQTPNSNNETVVNFSCVQYIYANSGSDISIFLIVQK